MKQSQKNIQIVKVQLGDVRKKRKVKRKTKGKKRSEVFSGTGQQPVLGQAFIPPMFPSSRPGYQFEAPKQQVVEKKEEPLKDEYVQSLDQLKKLQEYMKGKGEAPSPYNVPSSAPPSPFEAGNYWTVPRFSDTPPLWRSRSANDIPRPIDRPQQSLVAEAAEAASSSPVTRVPKFIKPKQNIYSPEEIQLRQQQGSLSRAFLRGLPFRDSEDKTTLRDIADMLNIGIPDRVSKDELVEIIYSYRPI